MAKFSKEIRSSTDVRSKAMDLLLMMHCLFLLPVLLGLVFDAYFEMLYLVSFLVLQSSR